MDICSKSGFVERCRLTAGTKGPLEGVRLTVKDNIEVSGRRYTAGHSLFAFRRGARTAPAVGAFMRAGAEIVGMTCTDAGGLGVTTPGVVNPLDSGLIVGGSSGGGAASVAACEADLAIGTDTAGSVRIPAACSGLFAYKPDYCAVPTVGVWPLAPSFDHFGLMARSRRVIFQAAHVILGFAVTEPKLVDRKQIRIGVESESSLDQDPVVSNLMKDAVRLLRDAGYPIAPIELPKRDFVIEAHGTVTLFEADQVYRELGEGDFGELGPAARSALTAARRLTDVQVLKSRRSLAEVRSLFARAFSEVDVIAVPTLAVPPPKVGQRTIMVGTRTVPVLRALVSETAGFNVYGGPVLALPCHSIGTLGRIPFSIQFAAARCSGVDHLALLNTLSMDLSGETLG